MSEIGHHVLVFDSGVGGLSVVSEIRARCPRPICPMRRMMNFGLTAVKPKPSFEPVCRDLLATLVNMLEPDVIVVACNTASTTALPSIRAAVNIPVIGVVPAIKPAAEHSKTRAIGVLGTPGTVRRAYVDESDC